MRNLSKALKNLTLWFQSHQRILPWRENPDVYRVWVSEIMLQQTQIKTMLPYFERFLKRFPDVQVLAAAPLEDVFDAWAGLGYYSRAKRLSSAAQQIVQKGAFPQTKEQWLELPGIGPYTAGAICSIALGQAEPILDGNVERVLARVYRLAPKTQKGMLLKYWEFAQHWVDQGLQKKIAPGMLNQAIMELGSLICKPCQPHCLECPMAVICEAFQNNMTDQFPKAKEKKQWKHLEEDRVCLVSVDLKEHLVYRELDGMEKVLSVHQKTNKAIKQAIQQISDEPRQRWRAGLWDHPLQRTLERWMKKMGQPSPHWEQSWSFLGTVTTHHVVTHHKIQRKTVVLQSCSQKSILPMQDFFAQPSHWRWISLDPSTQNLCSPLKKVLSKLPQSLKALSESSKKR